LHRLECPHVITQLEGEPADTKDRLPKRQGVLKLCPLRWAAGLTIRAARLFVHLSPPTTRIVYPSPAARPWSMQSQVPRDVGPGKPSSHPYRSGRACSTHGSLASAAQRTMSPLRSGPA